MQFQILITQLFESKSFRVFTQNAICAVYIQILLH